MAKTVTCDICDCPIGYSHGHRAGPQIKILNDIDVTNPKLVVIDACLDCVMKLELVSEVGLSEIRKRHSEQIDFILNGLGID